MSQDTPTEKPQTTPEGSSTGSVQLDSDDLAPKEEESDWPCDRDELELQYSVWDVPEPGKIFYSFLFNKERDSPLKQRNEPLSATNFFTIIKNKDLI